MFMLERKSFVFKGCASERYKSMVAFRPDIFRKISFKTIASYLGVSQSCLRRIRITIRQGQT